MEKRFTGETSIEFCDASMQSHVCKLLNALMKVHGAMHGCNGMPLDYADITRIMQKVCKFENASSAFIKYCDNILDEATVFDVSSEEREN